MKRILAVILIFVSCSAAGEYKHIEVGGGLYGLNISNNISGIKDDRLSGAAFTFTGIVHEHLGLRATLPFMKHDADSDIKTTGYELSLLLGAGMGTQGWKGYVGPGMFEEKWEAPHNNERFSGFHILFGFGYNWDAVALDLWWTLRDTTAYEDSIDRHLGYQEELSALTYGLALSARF